LSFSDQAIILKHYSLGEADRLVTLFAHYHGKFTVIAKGVRRPTSRKGASLELFNQIQGFFVKTKNLPLVTEVKLINSFENIKKDLEKVGQAWYVVELVDVLLRQEQKVPQVYKELVRILQKINQADFQIKDLRVFEVELLKILGFWSDEIHGKRYPADLKDQTRFNRTLIQQIVEKTLKSAQILEKW